MTNRYSARSVIRRVALPILLGNLLFPALAGSAYVGTQQIAIAAELDQVKGGTYDGKDYLTVHIDGSAVGPANCKGTALSMNARSFVSPERHAEIEALALSALLGSDTVLIVVPLSEEDCMDGRPTFTDLYLLPQSL